MTQLVLLRAAFAAALALTFVLAPAPASAGWGDRLLDKAKQKLQEKQDQAVDDAGDSAYDSGKDQLKKAGDGEEAPAEEEAPKAKKGKKGAPAGDAAARDAKGGAAAPAEEVAAGEVYGNKFDFVPGNEVLLYDDFAETGVGDYPARWTVKEGGGGNAVEVATLKGQKWFKAVASDDGSNDASTHWLRYDPKGDMPQKFTIEFDAVMAAPFSVLFSKPGAWGGQELRFEPDQVRSENTKAVIKPAGRVVKRISISVNGTYLKAYVGGTRVLQDPDGVERPITRLGFRFDQVWGRANAHGEDPRDLDSQMMTNFRLAEGGKDLAQALNADGRIVVHGIYFDTGSDVIKPESGGALRGILQLLQDDAALRFRVEGHTDDQGGDKVNGPLSDRRAAAVKAWLVNQGVAAGRLESKGLGASKPMGSNATQEGRANNRRVEFVKVPGTT